MKPASCNSSSSGVGLLRVRGLSVAYALGGSQVMALRHLDFEIGTGEIVGILGESGCGKSTLALAILGLLPADSRVDGSIRFQNEELAGLPEKQLRQLRGVKISLIHQEPDLSLSPVMRVGEQIEEVIIAHRNLGRKERKQEIESILRQVSLTDTQRICGAYPHQLSGGELHRVAIAQALVCRPDLIIADEPTRSLDVTTQAEILEMLRHVTQTLGSALIFITHNPSLLAGFADRAAVMYAGHVVEAGSVARVFGRPLHPYTKGLLDLAPRSTRRGDLAMSRLLPAISGGPPDLKTPSRGCAFEPRCYRRTENCRTEHPEELVPEGDHRVSCFNYVS